MPRKTTGDTIKRTEASLQEKTFLWDEIESLQQERKKRLTRDLWGDLDPQNEKEVRIFAHLTGISEEEALKKYYIAPDSDSPALLPNLLKAMASIPKEQIQRELEQLREENRIKRETEEAIQSIRERGTTLRDMTIGVTTTKKLLAAVKKYGSIDETLQAFRNRTEKEGFTAVERDMIPVIQVYGTPTDKAFLVILAFVQATTFGTPILSQNTAVKIRNEVKKLSVDEINEYADAMQLYKAMTETLPLNLTFHKDFLRAAVEVAKEVIRYEGMCERLHTLNRLEDVLTQEQKTQLSDLWPTDKAAMEKEIEEQWKTVKGLSTLADLQFTMFKSGLHSMDEWAEENNCTPILPYPFRTIKAETDRYISNLNLPNKYFRSHLSEMKDNGEEITDEDYRLAVIPSFNGLQFDEVPLHFHIEGAEAIKRSVQNNYDKQQQP